MGMPGQFDDPMQALFHDEGTRWAAAAQGCKAFVSDVGVGAPRCHGPRHRNRRWDTVGIEGAPEAAEPGTAPDLPRRTEQQLAILAVRLEMTAVYLRLVGDSGPVELLHGAVRTCVGIPHSHSRIHRAAAPTAHPEAELWLGAHPGDPAWLETPSGKTSLLDAVAADPEGQLGSAVRERFGDTFALLGEGACGRGAAFATGASEPGQAQEGYNREGSAWHAGQFTGSQLSGQKPQAGIAGFIG